MDASTTTARYRVEPGSAAALSERDPDATPGIGSRKKAESQAAEDRAELMRLQELLRAEGTRSLLVVLQGMDTSGKDGAIKKVFAGLSPSALHVKAFRAPTEEELAHTTSCGGSAAPFPNGARSASSTAPTTKTWSS